MILLSLNMNYFDYEIKYEKIHETNTNIISVFEIQCQEFCIVF